MELIKWLKEHFEILAASGAAIFGFGGIVHTQKDHGRRIESLEQSHSNIDEKLDKALLLLERIDERTK